MPILELKTYKSVCDRCGKVGSAWTNLPEFEWPKATPPGWQMRKKDPHTVSTPITTQLMCDECVNSETAPSY